MECRYKNGKVKNPLPTMVVEAKKCADMVSHKYNDPWLKRRLMITNPKIANLYCLQKIHKNPIAMIPFAFNINTPTEKLAQLMLGIGYPVKHGFSIKNSIDYADKINNI